jgi:hypothetical protein
MGYMDERLNNFQLQPSSLCFKNMKIMIRERYLMFYGSNYREGPSKEQPYSKAQLSIVSKNDDQLHP